MSNNQFEIGGASREWTHLIASDEIGNKLIQVEISPPSDVVPMICKRLNLHSLNELRANIKIQRNSVDKVIYINGVIHADLIQRCVITTDPVREKICDEFEAWFIEPNSTVSFAKAKRERMSRKDQRELPVMEESEDPEPITDGHIDLGEIVVQNLSLALVPYPKVSGAKHDVQDTLLEEAPEGIYDNPFAALKDWKAKELKKDISKKDI